MPGERRNLRSNKETSTNGEKPRSGSQSSSSKDKPVPTRTASKGKALPPKKGNTNASVRNGNSDKPQTNGTDTVEEDINGAEVVDMEDDEAERVKIGTTKEGEDKITVVVPPSKSSKLNGETGKDSEGDISMEVTEKGREEAAAETIDPRTKAILG